METADADRVRAELVAQLRESLAKSRLMMLDDKLEAKVREKWTVVNTNTAQVLNQVLRDMQFKDWEKRLKELEARKRKLQGTIGRLEKGIDAEEQARTERDPPDFPVVPGGGS